MKVRLYQAKRKVVIYAKKCDRCLICVESCPTGAITYKGDKLFINDRSCIYCLGCLLLCPKGAISVRHYYTDKGYCDVNGIAHRAL